jgi:diadenosine tetraphosphatase ApaH/serine/threonine PP2A family protein phosphatase
VIVAIVSDVHSNGDALDAVIESAQTEGAETWWCLGDVVGYGAEPDKVVDRIRAVGAITVAGNHDWAACGKVSTRQFNRHAAFAAEWTAKNTSPANLAWLAALPLVELQEGVRLVHATPSAPEEWNYCMRIDDAWDEMQTFEEMVCMIGHSHYPGVFEKDGDEMRYTRAASLRLRAGRRYLVNVGSVGQPRDGDPRAAYAIYDTDSGLLRHVRVAYDVEAAQAKILAAGLPSFLASRLAAGD